MDSKKITMQKIFENLSAHNKDVMLLIARGVVLGQENAKNNYQLEKNKKYRKNIYK